MCGGEGGLIVVVLLVGGQRILLFNHTERNVDSGLLAETQKEVRESERRGRNGWRGTEATAQACKD